MSNQEFKPCQFCSGEPNPTHDDYVHDDLRPMPVIECKSCSAWVRAEDWNRRKRWALDVDCLYPSEGGEVVAALSAVTAERDRLREERDSQQRMCIAEMEKANQLRAEVERLRLDAAAGAVVWKFIDRMADPAECDPAEDILAEFVAAFDAAMAAKEA